MSGRITVQWCPRCDTWKPSQSVETSILKGSEPSNPLAPVSFEFFRQTHRCSACKESFVTVRPGKGASENVWLANAEAGKLRLKFLESLAVPSPKALPASWDSHPELADFSAVLTKD